MKSVTIYASTDSAEISGESATYSTARSTATGHNKTDTGFYTGCTKFSGGNYKIWRSFLKFDTSQISGIIVRVQLRIGRIQYFSWDGFSVGVYKQNWSDQDPIDATNRQAAYENALISDIDGIWTIYIAGQSSILRDGVYFSEDLDTDWISTTDATYYSLVINRDYDDLGAPDEGKSNVVFHASPNYTLEGYRPALIIDYIESPINPQPDRQYHYLYVDWEGDGSADSWQDEASRVTKFALDRGKDRTIGAPGSGFQMPNIGRAVLTLDNHDGRYDPWNAGSPLYGKLIPGRRVNFAVWYNGSYYNLMSGYLADLKPVGYKQQATMIIEDGAGWLASRSPDIPLRAVSDAGDAISAVLDDMAYPFGRNIDSGVDEMAYYWTTGATALTEIHKLANSDLGRFCVEADGRARFRNRHSSEEVKHTVTEDQIGKNIYIPMPWDYSRSVVDVNTYPRILGSTDATLWTLRDTPTIADGDTLTLWGEYTYEGQRVPATGVYIASWEPAVDLPSTDLVLTAFSRDARVDITNNSGGAVILTELIIKGQPIYSPDKIRIREQAEEITGLPATFVMDYDWLTNINIAQDFAQVLLKFLSDPKQYPEIIIHNRPALACEIDLEERLRLVMDTFDIDKTFFVHKITHQSGASMQELITTVKLYPMLQDIGTDTFILDSLTQGILDTNKLGF